jgi:hypothetical protein
MIITDRDIVLLVEDATHAKAVATRLSAAAANAMVITPTNTHFRFCSYCKNFHPITHFYSRPSVITIHTTQIQEKESHFDRDCT